MGQRPLQWSQILCAAETLRQNMPHTCHSEGKLVWLIQPTQKKMISEGDVSPKKLHEAVTEKGSVSKAMNALPDILFAEPPVLEAKLKECLVLAESDEGGSKYAAQAISRIIKKLAGGES